MIIPLILGMSAELLVGVGQAAPSEATPYGYTTWNNFFVQAASLKAFPLGVEPYMRIQYMDHADIVTTVLVDGIEMGAILQESMTSYEIGLSRPIFIHQPFYLSAGLAGSGNFVHWKQQVYSNYITIRDQTSPGIVAFLREEYRRDYHPWLDEKKVTMVIGLSTRFHYMGFRPDVWPTADWFADLSVDMGVRW